MIPAVVRNDATKLWFSYRNGAAWADVEVYDYGYEPTVIGYCRSDLYLHIFESEYIYRSADGGTTWTQYAAPLICTAYEPTHCLWTGTALVLLSHTLGDKTGIVYSASLDYGITWSAPATAFSFVSVRGTLLYDAYADDNGVIHIAYTDVLVGSVYTEIRYRSSADDGTTWSAANTIVTTASPWTCRHASVRARNGHAWIIYSIMQSPAYQEYWTHKPSGGAWSTPALLHTTTTTGSPYMSISMNTLYIFIEDYIAPEIHEWRITDWDTPTPTIGAVINNTWDPSAHTDNFFFMATSSRCSDDDRALIVYNNYYETSIDYQQLYEWKKDGTYALIADLGTGEYSYFFASAEGDAPGVVLWPEDADLTDAAVTTVTLADEPVTVVALTDDHITHVEGSDAAVTNLAATDAEVTSIALAETTRGLPL